MIERMFKLTGVLFLLLPAVVACSQPNDSVFTAFRQKVVGHRFILRDFSAQAVTRYHYQDAHVVGDSPPLVKSAALFEIKEADLQGTLLTLRGKRSVMVEEPPAGQLSMLPQTADASILVDLVAVDEATALPGLTDELFFPSVPVALAAIPPYLKGMVPYRINPEPTPPCRDCTHWIRQGTWRELPHTDTNVQNPKLLATRSGDEPPIRDRTITHATGTFAFVVDEKGQTTELWLTRQAGYGLDEFWMNVLLKQRFWPAKYQGAPVAVPLAQVLDYHRF